MKTGTTVLRGTRTTSSFTASTQTWTSTATSVNTFQKNVSASPVTKGDFRSPTAWGYGVERYVEETGHSVAVDNAGNITVVDGYSGSGQRPTRPSVSTTQAYSEALSRAYGRIYGQNMTVDPKRPQFENLNVSVDIAEWHQVQRMLNATDQATSLFRQKAPLLRKAGSLWLQYVYGWRPLASTIYGAAYEMQNRLLDRVCTAVGRASYNEPFRTDESGVYEGIVTEGVVKTRAYVKVRYQEDGIPSISRWTSLNPASIAWELTPYSFVVDWFYNIGGYMQDFERALLLKRAFKDGFVSQSYLVEATRKRYAKKPSPGYKSNDYFWTSSAEWISFSRTVLTAPPLPRPPVLNTHLGSGRLLNAAGLLSQFLGVRR